MSDETAPQSPAEDPSASPRAEALSAAVGDLGRQERLVAAGAALILVVWLLFDLILDEYSFSSLTLLLAAVALFAVWVRRNSPSAAWPVPYEWTMRVLGYSVGFMGVVELLFDVRFGILDSFGDILGGLALYAGAFLMFFGARAMRAAD